MNPAYYGKCAWIILLLVFWMGDLGLLRFRYMYILYIIKYM